MNNFDDFDLPETIISTNPKEAIAFCIAHGIKEDVLPPNFKMGPEGYSILSELIVNLRPKTHDDKLTEIMVIFIAGYAAGSKQIGLKDGN